MSIPVQFKGRWVSVIGKTEKIYLVIGPSFLYYSRVLIDSKKNEIIDLSEFISCSSFCFKSSNTKDDIFVSWNEIGQRNECRVSFQLSKTGKRMSSKRMSNENKKIDKMYFGNSQHTFSQTLDFIKISNAIRLK